LLVTNESFKKQVDFLKRKFNVLSMIDFVDCLENKKNFPDNSVVITFDDGYLDNYTHAYPVLRKFNLSATIFLATDFIDSDNIPDWEERRSNGYRLMLNWEEVRTMAKDGVCFGAHTKSHLEFSESDSNNLIKEIIESKKIIERNAGIKVNTFAYPKGAYTKASVKAVKASNFACAFSLTNDKKFKDMLEYKDFLVERIAINEGMYSDNVNYMSLPIFACALIGLWRGR